MSFNLARRSPCRAILLLTLLVVFAADARAVTINWTPVGNPGNAADTSGHGAVPYNYNIDKYDVTNNQYAEFLNAKDANGANPLGLYNSNIGNPSYLGGISFTAGNLAGSKYSVISGDGNHPVANVPWYDAIRFANWLNNGQHNGDTETGAYTLLGGTPTPTNGLSITRNAGATVFLPSENEWYKAAYYTPTTSSYFTYPTSSNTVPTASNPTSLPNHANFYPGGPLTLTDVGAYTGTTSPYRAYDMGGNIWQWNEALVSGSLRELRGGSGGDFSDWLANYSFLSTDPTDAVIANTGLILGFRVVSVVPEPSTGALAVIACGMMSWWKKRFK